MSLTIDTFAPESRMTRGWVLVVAKDTSAVVTVRTVVERLVPGKARSSTPRAVG